MKKQKEIKGQLQLVRVLEDSRCVKINNQIYYEFVDEHVPILYLGVKKPNIKLYV